MKFLIFVALVVAIIIATTVFPEQFFSLIEIIVSYLANGVGTNPIPMIFFLGGLFLVGVFIHDHLKATK